jgi:hypothetical protein
MEATPNSQRAAEIVLRRGLSSLDNAYRERVRKESGEERRLVQRVIDCLHEVGKAIGHGPARDTSSRPWNDLWEAFMAAAGVGLDPDTVVSDWEWETSRARRRRRT